MHCVFYPDVIVSPSGVIDVFIAELLQIHGLYSHCTKVNFYVAPGGDLPVEK